MLLLSNIKRSIWWTSHPQYQICPLQLQPVQSTSRYVLVTPKCQILLHGQRDLHQKQVCSWNEFIIVLHALFGDLDADTKVITHVPVELSWAMP